MSEVSGKGSAQLDVLFLVDGCVQDIQNRTARWILVPPFHLNQVPKVGLVATKS